MATPIPYDYRLEIIEMRKKETTFHEIASSIPYSERSIKRIWKRYKENGIDGLFHMNEQYNVRAKNRVSIDPGVR